ncbi:probable sugar ABC transporter, permease protein [Candidatus Vecturithrix granuli]|uniref:Probable sugar ABC transporter, permease protein n=1 Tax=Vecturithrix granuli TaxID=1499967 RepID=A0A0S6W6C1_VECG1|nr:probable sugar ABC transporter, permease protein [Candidatus Vecturithrix granuli]
MAAKNMVKGTMSNESFITLSMLAVLAGLFIVASLFVPRFFDIRTISNQLSQQAELIILAISVTFILISGNFDLSVGGIVGLGAVLSAYFCQRSTGAGLALARGLGMPYGVAIAATLVCCMGIGAINAFFVTRMKVASIIVTLGTMSLARGIALILTQGSQRSSGLPYIYKKFGGFSLIGTINGSVVLMIILISIALIIEKKTVFGRRTYYIGANPIAAKLSGIQVEKHISLLYLVSSFLAGVVGVIMGSIHNAGISSLGEGVEFDALVITLLGGTSIMGGFGSVLGTVVGAFILGILSTSLNMLGLSPDIQTIVKGVVTLIAILAQRFALDHRKT